MYDKDHVSIYIQTIKGSFDDVFQWPIIKANVEFSVFSKSNERFIKSFYTTAKGGDESFKKPLTIDDHKGLGYNKYVPTSKVTSLVENDTLSFNIKVTFGSGK